MQAAAAPSSKHPPGRRVGEPERANTCQSGRTFISNLLAHNSMRCGGVQLLSQSCPRLFTAASANSSYGSSLLLPSDPVRFLCIISYYIHIICLIYAYIIYYIQYISYYIYIATLYIIYTDNISRYKIDMGSHEQPCM